MYQAKHAQQQLLLSPGVLHGHQKPVSIDRSQHLLQYMAQPALQRQLSRDEHRHGVQAIVCVTHDGQPTLHQLPPPLLFTRSGDNKVELFCKDATWTWSSLMQHWVEVKWIATSPAGQWVLGLKAAGSAEPAAVSLSTQHHSAAPAAAPTPPPSHQQQGAGVQQASMAGQAAPAAPEAPALPAAAPALPSGPEPHLCHAPCPAHDLAAMQEEVVGHSARPGTQFVATQWPAATVVATARPEAHPMLTIDSWTQLEEFTDRSLESLPKPMALQFGLHECGADKVELLVVLVHRSGSTGADQGPGCAAAAIRSDPAVLRQMVPEGT
ncbi:hypothetical protein QJQ45_006351 [Haematococcus lacustris]|nr:hypothetical protein QJQ45_006351 [Haematococcus lacustris]